MAVRARLTLAVAGTVVAVAAKSRLAVAVEIEILDFTFEAISINFSGNVTVAEVASSLPNLCLRTLYWNSRQR